MTTIAESVAVANAKMTPMMAAESGAGASLSSATSQCAPNKLKATTPAANPAAAPSTTCAQRRLFVENIAANGIAAAPAQPGQNIRQGVVLTLMADENSLTRPSAAPPRTAVLHASDT